MIVLEANKLSVMFHFYLSTRAKADRQEICAFMGDLTVHIAKQRLPNSIFGFLVKIPSPKHPLNQLYFAVQYRPIELINFLKIT